jgi:hypothetical protein
MRLSSTKRLLWPLALILGLSGCDKLDRVSVPGLVGPSELGLSVQLSATPDVLNADGISQSIVRITLRNQNGAPAPGKAVFVQLFRGDGFLIAGSILVGLLQTGVSVTTDTNGVAQVVYNAGTSRGVFATIGARPYSFDANNAVFGTVQILQE